MDKEQCKLIIDDYVKKGERLDKINNKLKNVLKCIENYNKEQLSSNNYDLSLKEARMEFEKEYLVSQIKRFSGNMTKLSEFTGMERTALYRKLKSLNISVK